MAAGDFVLAIDRHDTGDAVSDDGDLWRVDDGAIAEHWDVLTQIPAESADAWRTCIAAAYSNGRQTAQLVKVLNTRWS